jgi:hypothetical protein
MGIYIPLPNLPLVGVGQKLSYICGDSNNNSWSGTKAVKDKKLVMDFNTAPPADEIVRCNVQLLYNPE